MYPEPTKRRLFALLKEAGIGVVSDPHTGPLYADIDGLRGAGIPVALGQDDIRDAYYPFGRNNMLEVAFLAAHILWKTTEPQLDELYDMVTVEAAAAVGVANHRLEAGGAARIVVHRKDRVQTIIGDHAAPRYVLFDGALVAHDGELI